MRRENMTKTINQDVSAFKDDFFKGGFSTVKKIINSSKPQKCGIFLSNFLNIYVVCCCII